VFQSEIDLWQIPTNAFGEVLVGLAELQARVSPHGEIGEYLFNQLIEFNATSSDWPNWPTGECWCLCDSAAIGVLLDEQRHSFRMLQAPYVNDDMTYSFAHKGRDIRVYDTVNSRMIFEDMYAKLKIFADS
jgi:hypothetical protein